MGDYYRQFSTRGGAGGDVPEDDFQPAVRTSPFAPVQSLVGPTFDRGFSTAAGSTRGGPREPAEIVPGPMGTYERDKGRPFQQQGKFGTSLLGSQGAGQPGAPTPYARTPQIQPASTAAETLRRMADPANPENAGFFEGLFGGLFGLTGNEGIRNAGRFIGSGVDLPLEAAGNVVGIPLGLASAAPVWFREGGLNPDIKALYDDAAAENPINGLMMWSHAAKAQWQRDVEEGRQTGLMQDVGPAVAATDQLGLLLQVVFGAPSRGIQRVLAGGAPEQSIRQVEEAARTGDTDRIVNPAYQRLLGRLENGDFGPPGTKRARDLMVDSIIAESAILRDVGDPEQTSEESPLWFTGQGMADMVLSVVTDPTILATFGIGALGKVAKLGQVAANSKYWAAFGDDALRASAMADVERVAMRVGGFDTPERAWVAMGRTSGGARVRAADIDFEYRVLREVAEMPAYAAVRDRTIAAADYVQNWRTRWEPALRPIVETVRNLNDPQRLFGGGASGRAVDTIFSSNTTEGAIRAYGLDNHVALTQRLSQLPNDVASKFTRGLGVYTGNLSRAFFRNGLVKDVRRRGGVPFAHTPDEVIASRMAGARGADVATGMEQLNLRVKPLYLATERGGAEVALQRGREEAANRLRLMGTTRDEADTVAAGMNRDQIAELDAAYFGWATDEFLKARSVAIGARPAKLPKGAVDPELLTILGPRQMTVQIAEQVLNSVKRGAMDEVREALRRYDILFENFSEGLSDTDLLRAVKELLEDQIKGKALPRDLNSLKGLSNDLQRWASDNSALGYRPGFRPDEMWRVTVADEKIVGVNPWTELAGTAADVPTYSRFGQAKDMLFHNIRGERILADARIRLAEHVTEHFGMSRAQSDAIFARFIRMAQESGITPRGMSPEQIYNIFTTHRLPSEVLAGIGPREAIEALMTAFEGKMRSVGVTQKFTGGLKTGMGGQSNWIGQLAERIYPTVRFTLNPLFQAQELTEPFILNVMRGIKPGFRASDMDARTLGLVESLIRDSKYALDDQIERSNVLLWGADAALQAFGPKTRMGRIVRVMSLGGKINVKEVKRVNYARALRRRLGSEFEESMTRIAPDLIPALRATYATDDMGEIAVRYLSEKTAWSDGGRAQQQAIIAATKPAALGARTPVNLEEVAVHFEDALDAAALRRLVSEGGLSPSDFRSTLIDAGADPGYAARAYVTASAPFGAEEWWDGFRDTLGRGNASATRRARDVVQMRAQVMNMSEEEYLARTFADIPMGTDARDLIGLAPRERQALQFMVDAADESLGQRASVREAIENFRRQTEFADRENFAIIDGDGTIISEGSQGFGWRVALTGETHDAGIDLSHTLHLAPGRVLIHNHPSRNAFSPADISTAVSYDVGEMWITGPGITHILKPEEGFQFRDGLIAEFGDRNNVDEQGVRGLMDAMWREGANNYANRLRDDRFFGSHLYEEGLYPLEFDAISTIVAVQKIADRFGWQYETVTDFALPTDVDRLGEMVKGFASHPPPHLAQQFPYAYTSLTVERVDAASGTAVAFEFDPGGFSPHAEWFPAAYTLPGDAARNIMDSMEQWVRTEVAPRFGVGVTDVVRARGGWLDLNDETFYDNVNSVLDVFGSREQVEDFGRAIGYLLNQSEVALSRPKIGRTVADYDAGEAWALQFVATRTLTADEAIALQRSIADSAPGVANWGSAVVTMPNGRTAVRYVRREGSGKIDMDTFDRQTQELRTVGLLDAMDAATPADVSVTMKAGVMDTSFVGNNWEEAPDGSQYLTSLSAGRAGLGRELESSLAREATDRLAAAYRLHAPNEFADHLDALRRDGKPIPTFHTPGEYVPAPLDDRLTIFVPGGEWRLRNPANLPFSLWEQQIIKAQRIDPERLWNTNPDLAAGLYPSIWGSKNRPLDEIEDIYNAYAWGVLTTSAPLDVTEAAFPLLRAQSRGITNGALPTRAHQYLAQLPPEFRDDPSAIGIMFQLNEGLRISSYQTNAAEFLTPESRTAIDRISGRIDAKMRTMASVEDRKRWAARINARLGGAGGRSGRGSPATFGVPIQVHPFPVAEMLTGDVPTYVSIPRPNRMKGTATNKAWGNIIRWLASGMWNDQTPAVQRFLRQRASESRTQYAMRMASVLPGIDVKTGLLAMSSAGPGSIGHGALDTHMLRFVAQRALARGELERAATDIIMPAVPGSTPVPQGYVRAYHFTRNIDAVEAEGLDVTFAKGSTYGEPNAIWFSTSKPDEDATNFVEVFIKADEIDSMVSQVRTQADLDDMMARGSNFTVRTEKITPDRFVTVSRPRENRLRYIAAEKVPGTPEAQQWIDSGEAQFARELDDDYRWAVDQWEAMHNAAKPGLLDRLSPGYAKHMREQLQRSMDGKSAFEPPTVEQVFLLPESMRAGAMTPEKMQAMRSRLHLIPDPEMRAMYDDDEVLNYVAASGGKVNLWGGDYAVVEEYLRTTLRSEEVDALRAAGHGETADWVAGLSGAEWQWLLWDRVRASAGFRLDPHVSISKGANLTPPKSALELDQAVGISRMKTPYNPRYGMVLQEEDGRVLGANAILADERRILLATQHADARTGLHELAHAFERDLDPSQRGVILEAFRVASGSGRRTWSREVSEWWADQFLSYAKSGKTAVPGLRSSFEYFRRVVGGVESVMRTRADREAMEKARTSAINKATKAVERTAPPKDVLRARDATERAHRAARRELQRARRRTGVEVIENRWKVSRDGVIQREEAVREAKERIRALAGEVKAARTRATVAAGTPSAGGLTAAIRRKEAQVTAAEGALKVVERDLKRARTASNRLAADVRGARRRTPLDVFEKNTEQSRVAAEKAARKAAKVEDAAQAARSALDDAKRMPVRPKKGALVTPAISDEMRDLFDQILNPPDSNLPKTGPGSPVDIGTHYNIQEEAAYEAASIALSRAEENAFTLHYYKRGRNLVERSINHPYFGLYPASYMWGKVMPEMIRFLTRTPFGIDAPLGGLALANNVYRQVMVQQQYDPEFREKMVERSDMFHLLALMTPALPWEVPVNAPLWARRVAEADHTHQAELAAGDADSPMMNPEEFGKLTREMLTYAFGPANAVENVTAGVTSVFGLGESTFKAAAEQVQGILQRGQGVPPAPGAASVDMSAPGAGIVTSLPPGLPGG